MRTVSSANTNAMHGQATTMQVLRRYRARDYGMCTLFRLQYFSGGSHLYHGATDRSIRQGKVVTTGADGDPKYDYDQSENFLSVYKCLRTRIHTCLLLSLAQTM